MCETVRCARMRNSLEKWTNEMHADGFFPPKFFPSTVLCDADFNI
jgi:hypothetical protein